LTNKCRRIDLVLSCGLVVAGAGKIKLGRFEETKIRSAWAALKILALLEGKVCA
jgi:hypothetical protein